MNYSKYIFFCICLVFMSTVYGQSKKAEKAFSNAREALKAQKLDVAQDHLDKAISLYPEYKEAWSMKGDIWYSTDNLDEAILAYQKSVDLGARNFVRYKLAISLMENMNYASAEATFQDYLDVGNIRPEIEGKVLKYISNCNFAKVAILNPVPFEVKDLGSGVNTSHYQYHPSISIDGRILIYTQKDPEVNPSEDFYYSSLKEGVWQEGKKVPGYLNTSLNEGVQAVTADGLVMYYTICHREDGKGSCDIYRSELMSNGLWNRGVNLGDSINTGQWESMPTISSDGNTLYFVRGKRSSSSSTSILMSKMKADGSWTRAKSVSKNINTKYRETSPFIHFDNQTLYFSSDGHPGMGKKDIFVVRKDDEGEWGEPVNVGYPINTPSEDFGLVVSSDGIHSFFASDRIDTAKKSVNLYEFNLPKASQALAVAWIEGRVSDKKTRQRLKANIEIVNLINGNKVLNTVTDENGNFFVVLPANRDYAINIEKEAYLFHSQNFNVKEESYDSSFKMKVELSPIQKGEVLVLNNIFFDTDSYDLKSTSNVELGKLLEFLSKNPSLKIRIDGHTDSVGGKEYNLKLSENRAKKVRDYLIDKGVSSNRLSTKGFGDTVPLDSNETEEGRATNRRTEITIL